jgi:hypothetical protein
VLDRCLAGGLATTWADWWAPIVSIMSASGVAKAPDPVEEFELLVLLRVTEEAHTTGCGAAGDEFAGRPRVSPLRAR